MNRPICIIGSLYKILSKLLSARLREVVGKLVSSNQTAFIPGRNILDGVLVVNEVLDLAKREKRSVVILKVDFEKAYDRVSWNFIRYILRRMGYGVRWMKLMESYIFTSSMSVLINGSTTKDFSVEKGPRQGDPLSPFIFVLVMKFLTILLKKAKEVGEFRGFKIKGSKEVDLLQFADDTIIVAEGDSANLWSMKSILRGFELMSGSRINFHKSNIFGVNVDDWYLEAASAFLLCKVGFFPFKYLGVKVGHSPRSISMWKELLVMLKRRLSIWKGRHLSLAGRVILINSVLSAIPIYTLSFYKVPKNILNEIKSTQANFLWNGGDNKRVIHWVSWDMVCKDRAEGGLGIKNVEILNVTFLSKWKWIILTDEKAIWREILKERYGNIKLKVLIEDVSVVDKKVSIWWRDLITSDNYERLLFDNFSGAIDCKLGNGAAIQLWYAFWASLKPLIESFLDLFAIAINEKKAVIQAGDFMEDGWKWRLENIF